MPTPGAPLSITETELSKLGDWLNEELEEALLPHSELEEELAENHDIYMAEPKQKVKTFPWRGAANIVIPLVGITTDSIIARIVNTIFGVDPFWTVRPLHKDFVPMAKPVEDFMDWSRKVEFPLYPEVKSWCIEVVQDGWGWLKCPWEVRPYRYWDPEKNDYVTIKQRRPRPQHVLLNDIIRQAGVEDEEQAEWFDHRIRLTDTELIWRKLDDVYTDVDEILKQKDESILERPHPEHDERIREKLNTLHEVYIEHAIPGRKDQTPINFIATFHKPSRKFVRLIHNPLFFGGRPFIKGRFVEIKGKSRGLGIARQLKYLQEELETIHCQQVDNATIANTRFFVGRRNVIKQGTRVWPGRFLTTPNPKEDIHVLQLGDVYQSMHQLEVSILAFAEKRSGVSDYVLGRESSVVGSRATATGTLAILQEGNRRFDLNVRDMRASLGDLGRLVLQLNQQFRPRGLAYFIQGDEGELVEQTLDLPREFIMNKLGVELTASSATINRQVEQQGLLQLMGILVQNLQLGQQASLTMAHPQVPAETKQYIAKAFEGIYKLVVRIAQTFDQKNFNELVPSLMEEVQRVADTRQAGSQGSAGAFGRGPTNPALDSLLGIPPSPSNGGVQGNEGSQNMG